MLNRAPLYDLSGSDVNLYCLKNVFTYVLKLPWQLLFSSPPDPSPNALEAVRISVQVPGSLSLYEGSEDGIFPLNSPDSISVIQVLFLYILACTHGITILSNSDKVECECESKIF